MDEDRLNEIKDALKSLGLNEKHLERLEKLNLSQERYDVRIKENKVATETCELLQAILLNLNLPVDIMISAVSMLLGLLFVPLKDEEMDILFARIRLFKKIAQNKVEEES